MNMKQSLLWPAQVAATDPSLINVSEPMTLEEAKQRKHVTIVIDGLPANREWLARYAIDG